MISHLPLRVVASALTLATAVHPSIGRCQAAPAAAARIDPAITQMRHISIATAGKGTPVVLIRGLSSPRATWDGVVPALGRTHRVIVVQVNGFAGDDPRGNLVPGVLEGIVADLHGYLSREKLGDAAVVGHSMGGLVALKLASAHPGDAGKLMIVDALPFYGRLFGPTATPAMLEPRAAMMRDAARASYGRPADPAAAEAIANQLALKPGSRALVKAWSSASDPRVSAQAMYEDLTTDVTAELPRITAPVTLVVPFNDGLPQAKVDALYRAAYAGTPRLKLVDVGDAAHFVMLDQPERFAEALATFLAE